MDLDPHIIELIGRYLGAGLALGFGGIGAAVGMGLAAGNADEGIMRQPETQSQMVRTMLIGQAVGGSPSIFALVIGLMILFVPSASLSGTETTMVAGLIAAGIAIGLGCFGSGLGCGWPAAAGCSGVARNPRHASRITQAMIIGQAVAQSPSIFAAVIALVLLFVNFAPGAAEWAIVGIAIGAGIAMGAGGLGPGLGSGVTAGGAISGLSLWPQTYGTTVRTMLIGQAVAQTPAIFGLLIAFIMMFAMQDIGDGIIGFARAVAAGVAVGFGGIGPGIGSGIAAERGCSASAARPRIEALVLRTMLIGQAVSQSTAIYSLIIALIILYVL